MVTYTNSLINTVNTIGSDESDALPLTEPVKNGFCSPTFAIVASYCCHGTRGTHFSLYTRTSNTLPPDFEGAFWLLLNGKKVMESEN